MKSYTYGDLEQVLAESHERSMSKDECEACEGRSSKLFANMMTAWLDEEFKHNTDAAIVMMTGISLGVSCMVTTFTSVCGTEKAAAEVLKTMRSNIIARLDRCIKNLEEIDEANQKETT